MANKIKYIGRTTDFSGKTLWELLGNLKNYGVGRLVKRNMLERYQEPSFFRILKVDTLDAQKEKDRKVRAFVEKVFRGRRYPEVIEIEAVSYKADYRLVPRNEEKLLWEKVAATVHVERTLPETVKFPPLLEHILKQEMSSSGKDVGELRLKLQIRSGPDNVYRTVKKDEVPTIAMNQPKYTQVYET